MKVNIYNQCSDLTLKFRGAFVHGADWSEHPAQEIDSGSTMSVEVVLLRATCDGVLMYQLQRKDVESDDQPELTRSRLLVAWKAEGYEKPRVSVQLMESDRAFRWDNYWDKFELEEYQQRYTNRLSAYIDPIKETWLMDDGTVLMTGLELDFAQKSGVLNITISEGIRDEHTKRSVWIGPER
jgi:hypothetical protein